ncbi:hypothetical protein Pint_17570 [Pistacia integerrima]|uniref:Uncharacterized protein n=1 Tax=Pistacia integerrima TaxID=434235 RepID=A0ACC0Z1H2_9ROSI|nr:hypothetical protein Pint_17570 [Pistacia integerrima]
MARPGHTMLSRLTLTTSAPPRLMRRATRALSRDQRLVIPLPGPVNGDSTLYTDLVHAANEEGTKKLIESARLKLRDVLNDVGIGERVKRTLTLKGPSGRPQGKVEVKVNILEHCYAPLSVHYTPPYGIPSQVMMRRR